MNPIAPLWAPRGGGSIYDFRAGRSYAASNFLLESLDQVKVGQHAVVAIDTILGVGCQQNGADILDPCGIGRHELLPGSAFPGLQIEAIDLGRQLTRLVEV